MTNGEGNEGAAEGGGAQLVQNVNANTLEAAGILTPKFLSETTLKKIEALSSDQIKVLVEVHKKVSLNAFINDIGPQEGN